MASSWRRRLERGLAGQTESDRLRLFARLRRFETREDLEDWLCQPVTSDDLRIALGDDPLACALATLVIDRPGDMDAEPIEATIDELLERAPRDCYPNERHCPDGGPTTIRQTVAEVLEGEGGKWTDGDVVARLREYLSEAWHVEALADVGVCVELEGDRLRLTFVDPCHAHRERLGRGLL